MPLKTKQIPKDRGLGGIEPETFWMVSSNYITVPEATVEHLNEKFGSTGLLFFFKIML